jgi:formiminotetrahydrofolate cyclodeaminase
MSAEPSLAQSTVGDVIAALSGDSISPGAGAAGAMALALAAACAGKAVAISLKHRPEDAFLTQARSRLAYISQRALAGADEDASRFEEFMQQKDADAAEQLIEAGENLCDLAKALKALLAELEARVDSVVHGDIVAAQSLCKAFTEIQSRNLAENRQAASEGNA